MRLYPARSIIIIIIVYATYARCAPIECGIMSGSKDGESIWKKVSVVFGLMSERTLKRMKNKMGRKMARQAKRKNKKYEEWKNNNGSGRRSPQYTRNQHKTWICMSKKFICFSFRRFAPRLFVSVLYLIVGNRCLGYGVVADCHKDHKTRLAAAQRIDCRMFSSLIFFSKVRRWDCEGRDMLPYLADWMAWLLCRRVSAIVTKCQKLLLSTQHMEMKMSAIVNSVRARAPRTHSDTNQVESRHGGRAQ